MANTESGGEGVVEVAEFAGQVDRRIRVLTTSHTAKGVFVKAYLETFRQLGGDELFDECSAVVGERHLVDFQSYPYAHILRMGVLGAARLAPRLGGLRPYLRTMGRVAVDAYLASSLGRVFLTVVRPSPEAMLRALPAAISTVLSFGERTCRFGPPGSATLECRSDLSPAEANAGAVEAVVRAARAEDVMVEVEAWSELDYDLIARWRPR